MKLTIIKKTIKEGIGRNGSPYKIASLFVKFDDEEMYKNIVKHLQEQGAEPEKIEGFCSPNEYNGRIDYAFGLNCSSYTFDRVEQFGVLDAKVIFSVNDRGYVNARIQVIDRVEQVTSYDPPQSEVTSWASGDAPKEVSEPANETPAWTEPKIPESLKGDDENFDDLPF